MEALFDIVWFMEDVAEQAMYALRRLPEIERESRGKTHHFRHWVGVPLPQREDGSFDVRELYQCVCVDYRGSVQLNPGAYGKETRKLAISEFIEGFMLITDGCYGARIKEEVWSRPEFKKEIAMEKKREAEAIEKRDKVIREYQEKMQTAITKSKARFITVQANLKAPSPELSEQELYDLMLLLRVANTFDVAPAKVTDDHWLSMTVRGYGAEKEKAEDYDPMSFLEHSSLMRGSLQGEGLLDPAIQRA